MSMKDLLDKLQKSVEALANPEVSEETTETETPETTEMSMDEFVAYVTAQVEKAKTDTPEVKAERLKALAAQIDLAKNFEGPTPGKVAVQAFKDPAQITPTSPTAVSTPQNAPQTTNFTSGPETAPAGSPTTPSGGNLPPQTAGGSGFDSPATATFAKAMEDLQKSIQAIAEAKPEPVKTEPVKKAEKKDPLWPLDMNTAFGRGNVEDDETPEWGFDPHSDAAERAAAEKAEKTKAAAK